ncbi:MAG: response regulator [Bacteroidales bacterium]|nr:response regulator [Bacteroidales bacterium]
MGTQRKISVFALAIVLIAIIVCVFAFRFNQKRERLITDYNQAQLIQSMEAMISSQQSKVYQVVYDYTYWDDIVTNTQNPDTQWGKENLSSILASFHFHGVWLLNAKKVPVYRDFIEIDNILSRLSFNERMLNDLHRDRAISYFIAIDSVLYFIQGATIHPTNDPKKLSEPQGYFFLAERWDKEMLRSFEAITGCDINVFVGKPSLKHNQQADEVTALHTFHNYLHEEVGYVKFNRVMAFMTLYKKLSTQMLMLYLFSVVGILLIITFLLSRLVSRPLRMVSEIIEQEDMRKMPELKKNSRDFERIGNIIEQFVKQKNELVQAMELVKASDRLKSDFLNNISHEVRTPLNGILGASTLLSDPVIPAESREELIWIMNQSTRRLLRTITQYMDISLLNTDNMPVEMADIELDNLLASFVDEFREEALQKHLLFELHFPAEHHGLRIHTDNNLLEKVLVHLLDNAVKFTETGKILFGYNITSGKIEFFVSDTGIGIAPSIQDKVFGFFMQEDSSKMRKFDGSGLGLAICRKICVLLNGNIRFESEKGSGTTFYVSMPFDEKQPLLLQETAVSFAELPAISPVILVAEDEESNFQVLEVLLKRKLNATVIRAINGEQAVYHCRDRQDIQLVFMDIKMPVMDGLQATREIKFMREDLPVIALTAFGMSGDEKRASDAGCDDYIAKPFKSKLVIDCAIKWLGWTTQ